MKESSVDTKEIVVDECVEVVERVVEEQKEKVLVIGSRDKIDISALSDFAAEGTMPTGLDLVTEAPSVKKEKPMTLKERTQLNREMLIEAQGVRCPECNGVIGAAGSMPAKKVDGVLHHISCVKGK